MENDEKKQNMKNFIAKVKNVISKMNKTEGQCILCMKETYNHAVIVSDSSPNGSDLGFGAPEKNKVRMIFATVCEDHDVNDETLPEKIRVAIEIAKLTDKTKYVENADMFLDMEE